MKKQRRRLFPEQRNVHLFVEVEPGIQFFGKNFQENIRCLRKTADPDRTILFRSHNQDKKSPYARNNQSYRLEY
ncbi:hypothetical protein [Odoribacter lunatus]|uniref:hypothetical protein n=1 Tax=Odoribacter lunatus TaxID=2941335 RepID=UPI00203C6959|nr:hypothetical protein [Odoribacter lunatus]